MGGIQPLSLPALPVLNSLAHNASVKCERMRSQKLRRRPDSCHAFHPEVSRDSGAGRDGTRPEGTRAVPVPTMHKCLLLHPGIVPVLLAAACTAPNPRGGS